MNRPCFVPTTQTVESSLFTQFQHYCEIKTGLSWSDPHAFYRFSVDSFQDFWSLFLSWSELRTAGSSEPVCVGKGCEKTRFFPELSLNYTENLLFPSVCFDPEQSAVIAVNEQGDRESISWKELRECVTSVACGLKKMGVKQGDSVIAVARNNLDSIIVALAAIGLGAIWSSVAPDLGVGAVLSRFSQLEPSLLFAHEEYQYQGKKTSLKDYLTELVEALPSLKQFVSLESLAQEDSFAHLPATSLKALADSSIEKDFSWPNLPFNHPLFVLYSSGTTGKPKAIVHGTGGTLIEHLKEHRLHSNLGTKDRLLFHTSCGWMMWNWQLSALASGTTLVVYDGSPTYPEPGAMWDIIREEKVSVFGTSPTYLQYCRDAGLSPREAGGLEHLRVIQSTGSVLAESHYDWVAEHIKELPLQSISGGTDIVGCFVLGHSNLPVFRGESQCVSLGMDVRAIDAETELEVGKGQVGELICVNPFPSRPLHFLLDPSRERFHEAYFSQHKDVWTHGDFIAFSESGTARIIGRSDGVMNIQGIRIGPAEIYRVLEDFLHIKQMMVVEQKDARSPGGTRMVLLLVLEPDSTFEKRQVWAIKKKIKKSLSPVHVPALVVQVSDLPTTFSGKLSTRAVRDAINGEKAVNREALRNPDCLDEITSKLLP